MNRLEDLRSDTGHRGNGAFFSGRLFVGKSRQQPHPISEPLDTKQLQVTISQLAQMAVIDAFCAKGRQQMQALVLPQDADKTDDHEDSKTLAILHRCFLISSLPLLETVFWAGRKIPLSAPVFSF
jgi:hypothetical protein